MTDREIEALAERWRSRQEHDREIHLPQEPEYEPPEPTTKGLGPEYVSWAGFKVRIHEKV